MIQENSYPGHPTYEFYKVPSVTLEAVNCQTMSGNFSVFLDIQDAFTGLTCRERISKFQKVDVNRVKLYRNMFDLFFHYGELLFTEYLLRYFQWNFGPQSFFKYSSVIPKIPVFVKL